MSHPWNHLLWSLSRGYTLLEDFSICCTVHSFTWQKPYLRLFKNKEDFSFSERETEKTHRCTVISSSKWPIPTITDLHLTLLSHTCVYICQNVHQRQVTAPSPHPHGVLGDWICNLNTNSSNASNRTHLKKKASLELPLKWKNGQWDLSGRDFFLKRGQNEHMQLPYTK